MNEEQTKHDLITPALHAAGWNDAPYRLALEQVVAPGRGDFYRRLQQSLYVT